MGKVEEYQQMMAWLTRPKSKFQEPRNMDQAALVDDLEPGALKDEMLKDFDPSQETYEEYLQRKNLERPFNMADGGRIGFKRGKKAPGERRMYSGRMMTEDQIEALRQRQLVPKQEGMTWDKKTKSFRPRKNFQNIDRSIFTAPKSAETKKLKATKRLKDFVENFKLENNGQLPTQEEILRMSGGKSETIQKYLTEGVDYAKRTTKQEAGRLAGLRSGEVRAVPEGQDPSYVKRAKKIKESEKFQSKQDKADLEEINKGKKEINKYFKNKPDAINNTEFGKNIKAMMAMRMDKDGKFYSRVMSDDYYKKKASEGKIYDLFDIKPVAEGGKNLRYPVNVNITPGQFNSAFIQAQVSKAFSKGVKPESVKFLDNYLKEKNIRVKLPNVGYVGADEAVAVTGKPGQRTFPKITKTLESMQAPEEIIRFFTANNLSKAGFRCDKANGGVCDDPRAYRKSMRETMQKAAQGDTAAVRKIQNLGKTMNTLRGAAKTTGYGALIEIGLAVPLATMDWAKGANKQEIVSNVSLGLFGKSMDEQLRDKDIRYKQISELEDAGIAEDKARSNLQTQGSYRSYAQNLQRLEDKMAKTDKAAIPFLRPNPQLEAGQMFDQDRYFEDLPYISQMQDKYAEERKQRGIERGTLKPNFDVFEEEIGYAGGGIASIRRPNAIPPESGPTPQGLPSMYNRVKRI